MWQMRKESARIKNYSFEIYLVREAESNFRKHLILILGYKRTLHLLKTGQDKWRVLQNTTITKVKFIGQCGKKQI